MLGSTKRVVVLVAATAVMTVVLGANSAWAVVRYAAPGGTAADTECQSPSGPYCSIGTAAGGANVVLADEAIILPGAYSDTAGDLDGDTGNPTDHVVQPRAGSVHGVAGEPRPLITLAETVPVPTAHAFHLGLATTLSHVEVESDVSPGALFINGGTAVIQDVIARTSTDNAITCVHGNGILRDSVCTSSGSAAAAVGLSSFSGQTLTSRLRNVTATSTGSGSFGLFYFLASSGPPPPNYTISVKAVIASGTSQDVRARASATGSMTTINLDHSNYDTAVAESVSGGVAAVTPAGSGTADANVTDPPLLAPDGYHQLAGSPTINAGASDASTGSADIDGQLRQIGLAAVDIGADELGIASATALECAPSSVTPGAATACTATVTAAAEVLNGEVDFASDAAGAFGSDGSCTLAVVDPTTSSCEIVYTPTATGPGTHQLTATYGGDGEHDGSQGSDQLAVAALAPPADPGATPVPAGTKKCKKKKKKAKNRSASAAKKKKKCKKRKKRK
jgi:Bacterial Ig-like domain (group 3)